MRLIENIVDNASSPLLGMDAAKKPPEMSMYLSVLRHGKMHVPHGDSWMVVPPTAKTDTSKVLPSFARIDEVLRANKDARVKISDVFAALRPAPLGVRDGLAPLLLAVYITAHYDSLAFYEDTKLPSDALRKRLHAHRQGAGVVRDAALRGNRRARCGLRAVG